MPEGEPVIVEQTIKSWATFGIPTHPLASVTGGTPADNMDSLHALLVLRHSADNKEVVVPAGLAPVLDFVLMNTATLLVVMGAVLDYRASMRMASKAIVSGGAEQALEVFVEETRAQVHAEGALL